MLLISRVLYANKQEGKNILSLSNELPGEAWLEFKIIVTPYQSATFRPDGIWGKLYWYSVVTDLYSKECFNNLLNYVKSKPNTRLKL
jgi:hypothetical protein